jgi:hypothetical protein
MMGMLDVVDLYHTSFSLLSPGFSEDGKMFPLRKQEINQPSCL